MVGEGGGTAAERCTEHAGGRGHNVWQMGDHECVSGW